jgi:hypothetical protein
VPQARVKNYGNSPASFPITFRIGAFYADTGFVTDLAPGDSATVSFTTWTATQMGRHVVQCTTTLNGDQNPANNQALDSVAVLLPSGIEEPASAQLLPGCFSLEGGSPNPFVSWVSVAYAVPQACRVKLRIYSSIGEPIRILRNEIENAGFQRAAWDGRDGQGRIVSKGVYFCKLQAGDFAATEKLVKLE